LDLGVLEIQELSKAEGVFLISATAIFLLLSPWQTNSTTPGLILARQRIFAWVDSAQMALDRRERASPEVYQKPLNLAQSQNDYLATAALQNLSGDLFERVGHYQKALQQYEFGIISLNSRQSGQLAEPIGEIIHRLQGMEKIYSGGRGTPISADLYRGEIGDIRKLLRQDKTRAHQELAVLLMLNAGNMYLQQEQFSLADSLYLQASRVARASRFGLQQQQIWTNLAWSAIKNGQHESAAWLDSVCWRPPLRHHRLNCAGHYWRSALTGASKNYDKAIAYLQQALVLYKTARGARRVPNAGALATAYLYAGDYRNAEQNYREALRLNENVQDDETGWHANGGLAKCHSLLGDLEQAAQYHEQYLKIIEQIGGGWGTDQGKISFLQNQEKIFQDYVEVALKVAEQKRNFMYARNAIERVRSQALNVLQQPSRSYIVRKEEAGHLDAGYFFFREQWPGLRLKLSGGVISNVSDVVQMAPNVFAGGVPALPPDEKALLAPAEDTLAPPPMTFLECFVLNDRVVIFVKSAGGAVHGAIVPMQADSLAELAAEYGRAIAVEAPRGLQFARNITPVAPARSLPIVKRDEAEVSRQLYELLIAPIRSFLPVDPQQAIVIVPHQSLWQLPFAALRNAQNQFFGDEHVLTYAASESSWRLIGRQRRKADHRNVRGWVVGNPAMPASLTRCGGTFKMQPLPGAQREAETIAQLLGKNKAELYVGKPIACA
jgi:tetratricopeptide (TPR) repeat protein